MVCYKLYYFNLKGRAEVARLLFTYAGQDFEDIRVEFKDWPALKQDMPYKQMPILEVDGQKLAKSHAIVRFLAREFDLVGKSAFEMAKCDEFSEASIDILMNLPWTEKDEEKKKVLMEKALSETLPPLLLELESKVEGEYCTGNEVVFSDIGWASSADHLLSLNPDILKATPKLLSIYEKIFAHPRIAKYVAARPKTSM